MKKIKLFIFPLLTFSLLASCGNNSDPVNKYWTVTFNVDGGAPCPPSQKVKDGDTATEPEVDPTKDGYIFQGWYKDKDDIEFDFSHIPIKQDITLRAVWREGPPKPIVPFNVSFEGINCTVYGEHKINTILPEGYSNSYQVIPDECATLPGTPTITGEGRDSVKYTPDTGTIEFIGLTGEVTIEIKFEIKTCEVTFDENGGTLVGGPEQDVNYGTLFKNIENKPTVIPPEDMQFKGWSLSRSGEIIKEDYKVIDETLTVYAIFIKTNFATINFVGTSQNCKLKIVGDDELHEPGAQIQIKAGIDVEIEVVPINGCVPVFERGITRAGDFDKCDYNQITKKLIVNVPKDGTLRFWASTTIQDKGYLENYSWAEIAEITEDHGATAVFKVGDTKEFQLKHQDLNNNGMIDDNEVYQTAEIIDFNNNDFFPSRPTDKLNITFQFQELLCDKDGYSLATPWHWDQNVASTNYDYRDSDLRKAIDGKGNGKIYWYEKGKAKKSTTYTTSAYDMLPDDLKANIKQADRPIAVYNENKQIYEVHDGGFFTYLFIPTYREMTVLSSQHALEEGKTYTKYLGGDIETDKNRIKHQFKKDDGAVTSGTEITDRKKIDPINWAGYEGQEETSSEKDFGADYWISSPRINAATNAWFVKDGGILSFYDNSIYEHARPIAPCFCI